MLRLVSNLFCFFRPRKTTLKALDISYFQCLKVYWCEGMDSRPFMYNTSMELLSVVKTEAEKIFNEK